MNLSGLALALLAAFALIAGACGDSSDSSDATGRADTTESAAISDTTGDEATATTAATATTSPGPTTGVEVTDSSTDPASTDTTLGTNPPAGSDDWTLHETGDDCACADGSDFVYFSREASPDKVVLYFEGGGACFTAQMCAFDSGFYKVTASPDGHPAGAGIFDFANAENPLADYSMIYVPYCSGDVHLGGQVTTYAEGEEGEIEVFHNGFNNASHGLDHLIDNFPNATEVLVTGSSAGGVPAPLFAGLVADALPDARVSALADASGGYASNPITNNVIGSLWGTTLNVPEWSTTAGIDTASYGIPDLFTLAGGEHPDIRMARYDNAFDGVQRRFAAATGSPNVDLATVLDENEALVESRGVDLPVYVAPGPGHTILTSGGVYGVEVEGVRFVDWLTTFVEGDDPGDVRCTVCE